ncbi:cation:proton antiporter [Streptomyces sp. NPDC055897]
MTTHQPSASSVLGGIALVLAVVGLLTLLCRKIGFPAVVGEIGAGIILGPSLLGALPGDPMNRLLPSEVRTDLAGIAQVGQILFLFIVGWQLSPKSLKGEVRSASTIWISSLAVPMLLGAAIACALRATGGAPHSEHASSGVLFALYLGLALSISALSVLSRMITDYGLDGTHVADLALGLAAADDLLTWCGLAVIVAMAGTGAATGFLGLTAGVALYLGVLLLLVRPLLAWAAARVRPEHAPYALTLAATGAFASAYVTSCIGVNGIFGAFIFGLAMPAPSGNRHLQKGVYEPLKNVGGVLMPFYFATTGFSVDLTRLDVNGCLLAIVFIAVAVLGKLGSVALSARATGFSWRDATLLGALMNSRGQTALVVLNLGLSIGLLTRQLFTELVLTSLVTTVLSASLLNGLLRHRASASSSQDTSDSAQCPEDCEGNAHQTAYSTPPTRVTSARENAT